MTEPIRLTVTIDTSNAAFHSDGRRDYEVARILRDLADRIDYAGLTGVESRPLRDFNGNTVGGLTVDAI